MSEIPVPTDPPPATGLEPGRAAAPLPPPHVPDHELIRRIGRGAYGEVWLARCTIGAYRAVKIVHRQSFDHDRPFEREFEGILKFEPVSRTHDSQVDILHVGRGEDCFYYVMELADDQATGGQINPDHYTPRTLKSDLLFHSRLPFEECVRIGIALATALQHLHENGLVHRDVKPSNIIFVNGVPKLADIGLVTGVDATRSYVGTEGFAAPEGPGTIQADLYSLGKVLYEAATGKDRQEFPELPTQLRELPDRDGLMELNAVIARACRHDPKDRYISAAAMRADLELLQSGKSLARLHRTEARLRFVQWAGAVVTAVAALAAGLYLWQARQTRLVRELAGEKTRLAEANHRLVMTHEDQLIRAHSTRGVQCLEADDPAAALPWLVEALERVEARDPKQAELHRLRLGTVLRYHPRLLSVTPISAPVRTLAFSPDGRWFAAGSEEGQVLIVDAQQSAVYRSLVHHGSVHSVEFSQDSRRLLTACEDGLARLWSIEDTNEPVLFPHHAAVRHATFSPGGELVLTASADRTARLWRAADGQPVGKPLEHSMPLFHASFSPNGRIIATGSGNRNDLGKSYESGEFSLWDRDTGNRIAPPIALRAASTWTAFSPDGTRAASSCGEAFFDLLISRPGVLVETATAKVVRKLEHIDRITHVAFSPDGKRLASAALGYEVMVGDAVTGEPLIPPLKHARWVHQAVFSPDGRWIATASSDGTARVWDAASGVPITPPLKHLGEVFCVAFDPSGRCLATAGDGGLVCLWDIGHCEPALPSFWSVTGELVGRLLPGDRLAVTYSPKPAGPGLLPQNPSGGGPTVNVWETATGRPVWSLSVPGGLNLDGMVAIGPEGDQLAAGSNDGHIRLWDLRTGQLRWLPLALNGPGTAKAFSTGGNFLATASPSGEGRSYNVRVWSTASGLPVTTNLPHPELVRGIVFSPDARSIATACCDGKVRLWEVPAGRLIRTLTVYPGEVDEVLFSKDGRHLLTPCKYDKTARLWDTETGALVFPPLRHSGIVWHAIFNPSENRILTTSYDMSAIQWNALTGERLDPPLRHRRGLYAGAYDGRGRLIATSSVDQTVRLWSAETGELLAAPFLHSGQTMNAELTKDGKKLLTSSTEGRAQIWDLAITDWPLKDLKRYAEALSAQSLKPDGQLKALSAAEIAARIGELRAARPHDFEVSPDQLQRWHRREKIDSQRAGNDFAARFHTRRTTLPDFD